jgi:hypothetical protein
MRMVVQMALARSPPARSPLAHNQRVRAPRTRVVLAPKVGQMVVNAARAQIERDATT